APSAAIFALIAASMVPMAPATDNDETGFAGQIDEILSDSRLDGTISGVVVQAATTGERLYEHNPDCLLLPASNMQMLSSPAATELLGPDYTYITTLHIDGETAGNNGV